MVDISSLTFDEKGLIPAIVQDCKTKEVLMMAYMNKESLAISLEEGYTCFYSRSRRELWRKGETSGNVQKIVSIAKDCDCDTLLVSVEPAGPACHTGAVSCFDQETTDFSLESLYQLLAERKSSNIEGSYTSYLFQEGLDKMLKKIGEEATEVIIAAKSNDTPELVYEISDLTYHILVLMVEQGILVEDIKKELASRHVVDKKEKQQYMK